MLTNGQHIGHYQIQSAIGVGGMGEVYLAKDTQLDRVVALKVLPSDVASNQERMRRFIQEAKAAAALNHPNIAHIYEIGETDGIRFIAMEYVSGVTLNEKIHREKAPLRKLLKYLTQVAEGLAKAHAAGIVHRDLKPDNIMIARDDYAKILDFGLAKLIEPQKTSGSETDNSGETETAILAQHSTPGMIMGTAGYMSPEQAQGKVREIDHRSDIFSFGCILYEAATGQRAFEGKDQIDSLHKIVHAPTPQIKDVNGEAPADLQRIVRRCLAKEPDKRYQSIKDVAIELDELRQDLKDKAALEYSVQPDSGVERRASNNSQQAKTDSALLSKPNTARAETAHSTSSAEYVAGEIKRHKFGAALALVLLALVTAGVGFGIYKYSGSQKKPASSSSQMKLTRLTTTGKATVAAISPDGRYVVYAMNDNGQQSLWMRQTATQSNVQIVPPADVEYGRLIFSPDGNYLFYVTSGRLYQIPVLGGTPRLLLTEISTYMALSPDATQIVFFRDFPAEGQALMISNIDGTAERRLAVRKLPDRAFVLGATHSAPAWSPDGKTIACPTHNLEGGVAYEGVAVIDVASGQEKSIISQKLFSVRQLTWLADGSGFLMLAAEQFFGRAQLWQISYPEGEARRITNDLNSYQTISLTADSNSLVTVQSEQTASIWIAPPADVARAKQITNGTGRIDLFVRWTPANKIVFDSNANGQRDIWMMDADGSNQRQLTTESGCCPSVSPDGSYIAFQSNSLGVSHIFRTDLSGGNAKQLTNGSGEYVANFSPDGKWLLYASRLSGKLSLWRLPIEGGEPHRLTDKRSYEVRVSPDGKWLAAAYHEDTPNSSDKVAIIPFESGEPVKLFDISISGSRQDLHWTPDSRALIYIDTRNGVSNLWTQPIDGGATKQLTDFKSDLIFSFDYSRDGKWLAVSRGTITNDVVLISNFKQ